MYDINIEYLYQTSVYPPRLPPCLQDQSLLQGNASKDSSFAKPTSFRASGILGGADDSNPQESFKSQMENLIQIQNLRPEDEKLVKYCKFYMALQMNEILKETPITEICQQFQCKRGDVQTLQALAVNYSGMISAFCERMEWNDYSALFLRINEKINWCVKEELLDLMQIQSLRPERARALYNANLQSVESVAKDGSIEGMVQIFSMNDGFISHRKSNEGDLKIKYDYLYTLASKVTCEAKMVMAKRKNDPDRTMLSYMQEVPKNLEDYDYVLDSDYSSDQDEEKLEKKIEQLAEALEDEEGFESIGDETLMLLDDMSDENEDDDDELLPPMERLQISPKRGVSSSMVNMDKSPCYEDLMDAIFSQ
ncbi:hypothetical protein FGO68_gene147 [Halteria grandinella]|uniref:POLQ-like helical domain-containing protein n=1 Tax=Halteria grandinella TaxID=5974 RepID=A0A8J8T9C7_HALGN|nr:hypothetical protein FGO68_gene147 [Halteria grandinella]